jgi:hypothetical protein
MDEVATSKTKGLLFGLIPFLLLLYFAVGATIGSISIPGREGSFSLSGTQAWVACLFPFLWFCGDMVRHYPGVPLSSISRKLVGAILTLFGAGAFFYAILTG